MAQFTHAFDTDFASAWELNSLKICQIFHGKAKSLSRVVLRHDSLLTLKTPLKHQETPAEKPLVLWIHSSRSY